ncbi:MAG: type I-C CRISPR-associated protein Cas7/Csd2 [Candidatus Caenarcaniphilales bacterium]|nr:type I-C CRISPR-associated protein Cas7/Csd2 [Candidatus Caenarcaniphilales bacterium]
MSTNVDRRYEFILLYDVKDGNPNGDPDAGNMPRIDPETGHGLVSDVCLKRKIRNYVGIKKSDQPPYEIYVKEKAILNKQQERAYEALNLQKEKGKENQQVVHKARTWMCQNFYDIRTFGAVLSTGDHKCGQVRGAVQLIFSRSQSPIVAAEHSITRMAVTTENESEKQSGDNRTMGRKHTVPYGLYKTYGFVSAHLAKDTGFNYADLKLFFEGLQEMFDHDRSASRGLMTTRKLIIFEHDSDKPEERKLGVAPAFKLLDKLQIALKDDTQPPREFSCYQLNGLEGIEADQVLHLFKVTSDGNGGYQISQTQSQSWMQ